MVEPNLTDESFDTAIMDETMAKELLGPEGGRPRPKTWRLYWRRLLKRPAALVGTIIFCFFLFLAVFGPWVAPYDYQAQDAKLRLATPSLTHPFGADQFGRDIFSRVIVGTRNIFLIGGLGTLIAVLIGTAIGLIAGYMGGTGDEVIMRLLDVLLSFPSLLLAMVLLAAAGPSNRNIVLVVARSSTSRWSRASCAAWCSTSRTRSSSRRRACAARSAATSSSARSCPTRCRRCSSRRRMRFSYSIFLVASLGYLGLGVQPPSPDWGLQINEARNFFQIAPWVLLFPACIIAVLVISTSLMSDGLRQVMLPGGGRN